LDDVNTIVEIPYIHVYQPSVAGAVSTPAESQLALSAAVWLWSQFSDYY